MHEAASLWDGVSRRVVTGPVYWCDKEADNGREENLDEPGPGFRVRVGCWGGTSLTGKCWHIQQSDTVLPVPRIISLFIGALLNRTVGNYCCHILMWGYLCKGVVKVYSSTGVWLFAESICTGWHYKAVRQLLSIWGAIRLYEGRRVWLLGSL